MKKGFVLCLLVFNLFIVNAQIDTIKLMKDTTITEQLDLNEPNVIDTIVIRNFFEQGTQFIVSSLFGQSKKLSNADSIINKFDAMPSFGIFKDNYIVLGTELSAKPTRINSDAKFQVSIRQRLTNSTLPFKTYLFLTYTQKAFWGVFQDSFPFTDLNFNPSIGIGKALVYNNRYLGNLLFQFEHESNGKDDLDSRSWNKVSLGANIIFNDNWRISSKAWLPIIDGTNNKDIVKYDGWSNLGLDYSTSDGKFRASCVVVKRGGANLNANIVANIAGRLFSDDDQYLFIEYYNGYGESLLDYNQYRQRIRIGIVIKPNFYLFH